MGLEDGGWELGAEGCDGSWKLEAGSWGLGAGACELRGVGKWELGARSWELAVARRQRDGGEAVARR